MKWITLVMLGCFCVLSSFSYARITPYKRFVEQVTIIPAHYAWKTKKAASIADIWGITPDELDAPVNIFTNPP